MSMSRCHFAHPKRESGASVSSYLQVKPENGDSAWPNWGERLLPTLQRGQQEEGKVLSSLCLWPCNITSSEARSRAQLIPVRHVGHSPGLCPWVARGFLRSHSPTIEKPPWGGKSASTAQSLPGGRRRRNKSLGKKKKKGAQKGGKYFFEDKSYFVQFSMPWLGSLSAPVNA